MKKQYENNIRKGGIAEEIAILKQRREARKAKEEKKNVPQSSGQKKKEQDQKFLKMITQKKSLLYKSNTPEPYIDSSDSKIFVVVRKRPIFQKEINNGEIDCISVINPRVYIHECKIQIDGITKYLEDHEFYFDATFGENSKNYDIYNITLSPMINLVLNQGVVTCFAYGQTGSGKTFTMNALEKEAIDDLFSLSEKMGNPFDFYVSFFEIYRGSLYDLLNNKNKVEILDDKNGKVHIYGLFNQITDSPEMMHHIIDSANAIRTTHNTVTNETSSRSHAICNIVIKLKNSDEEYGKLTLVDLAGSERAQETQSNDKERRAEGAEINKSLLALKECIRALDEKKNNPDQHVPFRASKLTHVLRDSFVSKNDKSRIIMISCVMPSYKCCNHSLNTLRYSDRLKEKTKHHFGGNYNNININARGVNSNPIGNNNNNNNGNNNNSLNYRNANNNYMVSPSSNNKINLNNNNNLFHKSFTREITSPTNRLNNVNKKYHMISNSINNNINNTSLNNNNNINSKYLNNNNINNNKYLINNNNKVVKKENITSNNNKKIITSPVNDYKNNKKIDILKSKNSGIKYEDKFCMMKEEDELDKQKRTKYNYDNSLSNKNTNINTDKNNNKNNNNIEKNDKIAEKKDNYNNQNNEIINKSNKINKEDEQDKEVKNEEEENMEIEEFNEEYEVPEENPNLNNIGEDIVNKHMVIIKEAANILSQEGDLITNIKGVGKEQNFTLDNYIDGLELIVDKKLDMYGDIKNRIKKYRKAKKENGNNY